MALNLFEPVKFYGIDCLVSSSATYVQNRRQTVLRLVSAESSQNKRMGIKPGSPVATASACIPGYPFERGETAIKDYSENAGILDVLLGAGIVELTGQDCLSGFCALPVVRICSR